MEPDAVVSVIGEMGAWITCTFFLQGGVYTIEDIHYVADHNCQLKGSTYIVNAVSERDMVLFAAGMMQLPALSKRSTKEPHHVQSLWDAKKLPSMIYNIFDSIQTCINNIQ
ncbi:ketose-bisphosphate aldolase class-II family protein [Melia azedarach]|uniref:Ketose-bisphosphate aldolase class-II family protein n=1 Tax=Melia azedarach TaxID=155640 RepID=A0ACC1YKI8_MELAZ|nr:ketose-bisphosphate aldolase class-II family protein [Melia azedarach]